MANTVQLKRSATANAVPTTTQLALGELAINTNDGRLYLKKNVSGVESIVEVGSIVSGDKVAGGALVSNNSIADEGGEIRLAKAVTNTTLSTSVTIDVYQNKLRIFETGGTNRGAYIDLSAATAGVGSNLLAGSGASISVSDTAPTSPVNGSLWWNSTIGVLKIYYNDGTSSQWVDAAYNADSISMQSSYPQNIQSGNYTLAVSDAGKHIYSLNSAAQTITIPTDAVAAIPIGGTIKIINGGTNPIKLSTTGLTVYMSDTTTAIPSNYAIGLKGSATLIKVSTNTWWVTDAALAPITYSASYLIVGGGGSGATNPGNGGAGGGGAGGLLTGTSTLSSGTVYTITVGAGATAPATNATAGANGGNSSALGLTAIGGGGGGNSTDGFNAVAPGTGGSGGGAWGGYTNGPTNGAAGTGGQGNAGGAGANSTVDANAQAGGGGGGAGAVGGNASASAGGNGGNGTASSITGTSVTYAGGGGGGKRTAGTAGTGGTGGGGAGGAAASGTSGTANTGGGGGGAGAGGTGGNGGSGVVILSVPTASYSGVTTGSPTVTTSGANTILTFTSSGSYTA